VGARLLEGDRCYTYDRGGRCTYSFNNYTALGVRGPLGLALDFNNVPLDVFFEVALVLDFLVDHDSRYDNGVYVDVNGAFGIRYYFN